MSTQVRAVVPAKALQEAKSRLGREDLTLAFLTDVLGALKSSHLIISVTVVTSDPKIESLARELGCHIAPEDGVGGLGAAIEKGIDDCINLDIENDEIDHRILVVLGDLPCLRAGQIEKFVELSSPFDCAFLPDTEGIGSTMWIRNPQSRATPKFGFRSRAAHRESGAHEIFDSSLVGARRDVDTDIDLWDAVRIGVGSATKLALDQGNKKPDLKPTLVTISGLAPLTVVNESGEQINVELSPASALIKPRIGQRVILLQDSFVIEQ